MSHGDTPYGFRWGHFEVTRISAIEGRGEVLGVKVGDHDLEIYVSAQGRSVRLFDRGREIRLGPLMAGDGGD